MPSGAVARRGRTLEWADAFMGEVRLELERAAVDRLDLPPRLRTVHERPGHATPEFRTLAIPLGEGVAGASPEVLSGYIARFASGKRPSCMLLALEALVEGDGGEPHPMLIAEARDDSGGRFFLMQRFSRRDDGKISWEGSPQPVWEDPGEDEMILDAAFER